MQDAIRYGAPALTIDEARALAARIAAVVNERDELRREIHDLRLILGELASLREFLHDNAAGAMAASAQTNGSVHDHGPTNTARVQADDEGEGLRSDDTAAIAADDAREPPAGERRDESDAAAASEADTQADDHPIYQPNDRERPPADAAAPGPDTTAVVMEIEPQHHTAETPTDDARDPDTAASHTGGMTTGERRGEPDAGEGDAGETPGRPPEGTLMRRILELIEASDRPKRPWQIQKELNLPRMPSAELSRLLSMGCLTRPKEGVYAVPGRNYGASVSAEGNNS